MNTGLDRQIDTDADDEAVSTDGRNSETMVARCLLSYPVIRVPDQDISTELTGHPDQVLKSIPRPMQGRPLTVRQAETASFRDSRVGRTYPPLKDGEGPPFSSAPQRPRHGLFPRPAANAHPTRTVLLLLVPGGEGPVTALLLPGCRSEARKGAPAVNEGYEGLASERKELRHAEFLAWQTASSRCHLSFLRKRK